MSTATSTCPLPSAHDVGSLLGDLVGKQVDAVDSRPRLRPLHQLTIASYTTVEGTLVAAVLCDLQVASSLGAALALVPAAIANQSLETGTLSPQLLENLTEVLNVASRWLNGEGFPRLVLGTVVPPGEPASEDLLDLLGNAGGRRDFDVAVEDYGTGTLRVVTR